MYYRISSILVTFICLFSCVLTSSAQDTSNTDETEKPVILYSGTPKKYEIADIKVVGAKNYEDYVIIGLSGLSKGQTITVPGDEITQAANAIGVTDCSPTYKLLRIKSRATGFGLQST